MDVSFIEKAALLPAGLKSIRVKSWQEKQGDMMCKAEMHQDGPDTFENAYWRLGEAIPTLYRFKTFEEASAHYSQFIDKNKGEVEIVVKLQAENEMLHSLCASAQCWLDAAAHLARRTTKTQLRSNADAFRDAYAKITS